MSRTPIATIAGLLGLALWIAAAMILSDHIRPLHPAIQFVYFATAGFAWVFPIRWLMLWAAHRR